MQKMYRMAAAILGLAAVLLAAGCGGGGPKIVPAAGQITVDGQPLSTGVAGFVRFVPKNGRAATGAIDSQTGKFKLTTFKQDDGCLVGKHQVVVIVRQNVGQDSISIVPDKYADLITTDLELTVEGPTDALQVKLTGPLKPVRADAMPISTDPNKY